MEVCIRPGNLDAFCQLSGVNLIIYRHLTRSSMDFQEFSVRHAYIILKPLGLFMLSSCLELTRSSGRCIPGSGPQCFGKKGRIRPACSSGKEVRQAYADCEWRKCAVHGARGPVAYSLAGRHAEGPKSHASHDNLDLPSVFQLGKVLRPTIG